MNAIEEVLEHSRIISSGEHEMVRPGLPFRISEAASVGDGVWQGDLGIEIAESIPTGYVPIQSPTDQDRQLVPGNTQGARHCLDSLEGVQLFRPSNWSMDSLIGPAFVVSKERSILHPTHGRVVIPAGFTVRTRYQQNLDEQTKRARRAAD